MKKLLLLALLGAALWLSPFRHHDVAELVPVEALVVSLEGETVVLTGEGCRGYGLDWESALSDLRSSADGVVFLGTAEQVILSGKAIFLLPQVAQSEALRPAAEVCRLLGECPPVEDLATYLSAHSGGVTLQMVRTALLQNRVPDLPRLINTEGGLRLDGTKAG